MVAILDLVNMNQLLELLLLLFTHGCHLSQRGDQLASVQEEMFLW